MSKQINSRYRTTKVSVRRLVTLGVLSGAAVLGGVTIASASTARASTPNLPPLHPGAGMRGARPVVDGKVTGLGLGSFTVLDRASKSYTVDVTGTTVYRERNASTPGIGDIKVGTFVDVRGGVTGTSVTARVVRIEANEPPSAPFHPMGTRPDAVGKVTSVDTTSFTIEDRTRKTMTIDVTGTTTYEEPGVISPSIGDIKVGDFAAVSGTITGSTVVATDVHFGDRHPLRGRMGAPGFDGRDAVGGGVGGAPRM